MHSLKIIKFSSGRGEILRNFKSGSTCPQQGKLNGLILINIQVETHKQSSTKQYTVYKFLLSYCPTPLLTTRVDKVVWKGRFTYPPCNFDQLTKLSFYFIDSLMANIYNLLHKLMLQTYQESKSSFENLFLTF